MTQNFEESFIEATKDEMNALYRAFKEDLEKRNFWQVFHHIAGLGATERLLTTTAQTIERYTGYMVGPEFHQKIYNVVSRITTKAVFETVDALKLKSGPQEHLK